MGWQPDSKGWTPSAQTSPDNSHQAFKAKTSECEKPHKGTRGRVALDHCGGASADAARYHRAPDPGSRGSCTTLGQAYGQAHMPCTRRCNGGYALLRVLRELHRVVKRIHHP